MLRIALRVALCVLCRALLGLLLFLSVAGMLWREHVDGAASGAVNATIMGSVLVGLLVYLERLTATDTWLFLEAAYWHDIGMLVSFAETCDIFGDKQFIAFLDKLSCKPSDDLYSTINAIRNNSAPAP